jgi:8-oxo-dGTP pyrophosphatase MutT (NUDIX family)
MTLLKKWQILNSQWVINNRWCRVRQDVVKLPSGVIVDDYFVNIRPEIVLIVPLTTAQELVFVRQYRHGIQEILLEFPAGAVDEEESDLLAAAQRELLEETGYTSTEFIPLITLYDNPVKDSNKIHVFLALNIIKSAEQNLDITEEIEINIIPVSEVKKKILQQEINVSGSVAALYLALDFLERKN